MLMGNRYGRSWRCYWKCDEKHLEMWLRTPWFGIGFWCGHQYFSVVEYAYLAGWQLEAAKQTPLRIWRMGTWEWVPGL